MKRFWVVFLLVFIFLNLLINLLSGQTKEEIIKRFLFNAVPPIQDSESIKELERALQIKDCQKVIQILGKVSFFPDLTPEELLGIGKCFFKRGELEKASDYAQRVISLRRETELACLAQLLKVKSFYLLGKEKEVLAEFKEIEESFCNKTFSEKISSIKSLYFTKKYENLRGTVGKSELEDYYSAQIFFWLKKEDPKKAETLTFEYLSLSGDYTKGKELLFPIAEFYFRKGDRGTAKKYYQLIITEWDPSKEALLSKFRLYQIAYEAIKIKELLPSKMLEDLLGYIKQIKISFPQEELAEEAGFLEVQIYFDKKNWEFGRRFAKEFIDKYPSSSYLPEVNRLYCQSSLSLISNYFWQGKIGDLQKIAEEEKNYLKGSKCGDFYYALGSEFYIYKIYSLSAYYFLYAYDIEMSIDNLPDYFLKLAFIAELKGERARSAFFLDFLEKKWKNKIETSSEYLYLKTLHTFFKDLKGALGYLEKALETKLPLSYKEELIFLAFRNALQENQLNLAYQLLQNPFYRAKEEDFLSLLYASFTTNFKLFEEVLGVAKKRYPDSAKIAWISAYYLEKKGEIKESRDLWEKLAELPGWENQLAQQYKKLQELTERSQKLIY